MSADVSVAEKKPQALLEAQKLTMTFIKHEYPGGKGDEQRAEDDFDNYLNPKREGCYGKAQGRIDLYKKCGFGISDEGELEGEWEKNIPENLKRALGRIDPETARYIKNVNGDYVVRTQNVLENEIVTTESFISAEKIKVINAQKSIPQPLTAR